jgi:hypothetical protein
MWYTQELSFGRIKQSKPIHKDLSRMLIYAYKSNKRLFGRIPYKNFDIVVCNNKDEWKRQTKYDYLTDAMGVVIKGQLIIKSLELLKRQQVRDVNIKNKKKPKNTSIKKWLHYVQKLEKYNKKLVAFREKLPEDYQKVINHEMNHVFWVQFYGSSRPIWLFEGLASINGFASRLPKKERTSYLMHNKEGSVLMYNYMTKTFNDMDNLYYKYNLWLDFILFITKNDPKIIVRFMNKFSRHKTKSYYNKLFRNFFDCSEKEAFDKFIVNFKKLG